MAHYAFITDGIVTEVIAGIDESELIEGLDTETWYANYRGQLCKRTSYNNKIRGTYAGIGFSYDETEDIFITPQPYPSWTKNSDTYIWEAPTPAPTDDKRYEWDEATTSWVEIPTE